MASKSWVRATPENMRQIFSPAWEHPRSELFRIAGFADQRYQIHQKHREQRYHGSAGQYRPLCTNDSANLLMDYLKTFEPLPVTHVVDFDNTYTWYYFGGKYFRGNEYFYTLLTRHTKGNYYQYNYWDNNIADMLTKIFEISVAESLHLTCILL
jgi:hypothetical protein